MNWQYQMEENCQSVYDSRLIEPAFIQYILIQWAERIYNSMFETWELKIRSSIEFDIIEGKCYQN